MSAIRLCECFLSSERKSGILFMGKKCVKVQMYSFFAASPGEIDAAAVCSFKPTVKSCTYEFNPGFKVCVVGED